MLVIELTFLRMNVNIHTSWFNWLNGPAPAFILQNKTKAKQRKIYLKISMRKADDNENRAKEETTHICRSTKFT